MSDMLQQPVTKEETSSISAQSGNTTNSSGKASIASSNPLVGISQDQLLEDAEQFCKNHGIEEYADVIKKGALVAQNPTGFEEMPMLSEADKDSLRRERRNPWAQPGALYYLVLICSLAAALQGMDESVINGANLFFPGQFGIDPGFMAGANKNQWLLGLVNSAPYLCCGVLSCWLTAPLNRYLGRRGTIFVTTTLSFLVCIWQTVTNSWEHLFAARFVLGLGIGPNSATVPVFAAECAPSAIRGSLVGMWQVFTAFGIMLGYASDLVFLRVPNKPHITGLNWRLMMGAPSLPALLLLAQIWFCPESPRWLIAQGRHAEAFKALLRLRNSQIEAARDLYYTAVLHGLESQIQSKPRRNPFAELFGTRRNRRATVASLILMFMQQFCGVNAIAYYSSNVFTDSGFTDVQALLASWGFGMINWLFAIPALYTIDTFGRRRLLLTSYPFMSIFLLVTGLAFLIEARETRVAIIATGIYLFTVAYSPGAGPVPFAYSAEAYPMSVRDFGMSFSTAFLWFFNFVVAITFPPLIGAFTPTGAFAWYAGWNLIGFTAAFFFVPETKGYSLEELDEVFSLSAREYAWERMRNLGAVSRSITGPLRDRKKVERASTAEHA